MRTRDWEEDNEEERRLAAALRQLAAATPITPNFCARVLAVARPSSPTAPAAASAATPLQAHPRHPLRLPYRLRLASGALAAGLCLSLAVNGWLTFRMRAIPALRQELAAMQAQVRAAQAERRQWQAQHAEMAQQLAALQAREQAKTPPAPVVEPGVDLRGRPYTVAMLAQALFPEVPLFRRRGEGRQEPSAPASLPNSSGKAFVVLPLTFPPASAALQPHYSHDLDMLGNVLTLVRYAAYRVQIAGHTDSLEAPGTEPALSLQRAEEVQRYLVQHFGITPERLLVQGYGASQPYATNATPEGRDQNRRVEIVSLKP